MKIKNLLISAAMVSSAFALPAATPEWLDPQVNEVNRYPMHTDYFAFESIEAIPAGKYNSSNSLSLDGKWKFRWVPDADKVVNDGFEKPGYDDPIYINTGYAWRSHFQNNPPQVPSKDNHTGLYRREIRIPADWKGKDIIAHFGSVTSNLTPITQSFK